MLYLLGKKITLVMWVWPLMPNLVALMIFALQFGYYVKDTTFASAIAYLWIVLAKLFNCNLKKYLFIHILLSPIIFEAACKKFKK